MRTLGLVVITMAGVSLSGCSQISSAFKKKPHYHTTDGTAVYVNSDVALRTAPQQPYQFANHSYDVGAYDTASTYTGGTEYIYASQTPSASVYTGYGVELYNNGMLSSTAAYSDPRQTEFVKLNGESEATDWRNCEIMNSGYLYLSETDFILDPGFEVCMRNKGYVLGSEYNSASKQKLSADTVNLRGSYSQSTTHSTSSYLYP